MKQKRGYHIGNFCQLFFICFQNVGSNVDCVCAFGHLLHNAVRPCPSYVFERQL